jgi:hypothetical protein
MFEFYRNELKLSERYARSCCNYFKYNWRIFFGDHPEELQKLIVDQRQSTVTTVKITDEGYKYLLLLEEGEPGKYKPTTKDIEKLNLGRYR